MDNGGGEQAETRCAEALVLEGAVADFPLPVEEDGPAQRVAGLALVEAGVAAFAQGRVGQPLQREQGALDPAESRSARDSALPEPAADSLRRITDGMVAPASIDCLRRDSSDHCATIALTSIVSPIIGSSSGYVPGFSIVYSLRSLRPLIRGANR